MGIWSISPNKSEGGFAEIDQNGKATFSTNTSGKNIKYTITYTDEQGNCGSAYITQDGGCSGPSPTPTGCDSLILTATTSNGTTSTTNVNVSSAGGESNYVIVSHSTVPGPTPPTGDGTINIKLTNNTGSEIRLYGEVKMYISKTPANPCSNYNGVNVYLVPSHSTGWVDETNNIIVPVGGIKQWSYNVESQYLDGSYCIMEADCGYHLPLDLYTMYYTKNSNQVKKGNGLYHTKVSGHQYLTDGATINVEADYLGVADNVDKVILADENTRISTIPSDKTYVILLPNQTTLPA